MRDFVCILLLLASLPAAAFELRGTAEFEHRLTLNSSISGRVAEIHVSVGQSVSADDPLITLVSTGLQAQVDVARAEVDSLVPEIERAQIELDKAQEHFERDALAKVVLVQAQQNHAIARARLDGAEARLALAQFRLSQAMIRSPIDGIVLGVSTFPGQYINTRVDDHTLITVADNRSMSVRALLPVEFFRGDLLNQSVRVTYLQQQFDGRIVTIDRQVSVGANNHPAMVVQVLFTSDGTLPAGLPVRIEVGAN